MRKIIGFKLNLRVKEIQRRAKKANFGLEAEGLGEPELQELLQRAARSVKPGVLFETFPHPDPDQAALSPMPGLAYSLVLVTLGRGLEALKAETRRVVPSRAPLWDLIEGCALDEGVRFATSLLEEEAAKDSCELSPMSPLSEASALEAALRKLDGSKIGVGVADGGLVPTASIALSLSWLSKSKAKGKSK